MLESANGFEAGVPSLGIPSSAQHSPTQSDRYNNSFPQMIALPSTPYSHLFQNITTRSDCQSNIKIRRYKVLSIQDCLDAVGRLHDLETPDGANGHNVGEFGNVVARDSFHRGVFPPTSFEAPSSQFDDIGDLEQFIDYDGGSAV